MKRGLLVVLLVLLAAPAAHARPSEPVAVMPFRNLNQTADLDWLRHGIAETMITDIRNRAGMTVVERDQIEEAIAELNFQETKSVDATTAAAIGRVVGAKTIVVGGYQQAGGKLRITARFVTVETGVIQDTAKITGPLTTIFKLQDQIVSRLLGVKGSAPPHNGKKPRATPKPPKKAQLPPSNEKTVKAYKLYAMSLNTRSDAKRMEMLQASLEVDPNFFYAKDDILELERRMRAYHQRALEKLSDAIEKQFEVMRDEEKPEYERSAAANQIHIAYIQNGFYRADLALAEEVYGLDWRNPQVKSSMRPAALQWMLSDYDQLGEYDMGLQVGEQFMQEFATSPLRMGVEYSVKALINKKLEREKGPAKAKLELAELAKDRAELTPDSPNYKFRMASLDNQECVELVRDQLYLRAIRECEEVVEKYDPSDSDLNIGQFIRLARFYLAKAHVGAGNYRKAQEVGNQLIEDEPDFAREMYLEMQMRQWPKE